MTIEEYTKIDSTFNRSKFIGDINSMMLKIYEAVSNDNLESVHLFLSNQVYQRYQNMINRAKEKEMNLKYDNVFIDSEIESISRFNGEVSIMVEAECSYSKYYTKDNKIVEGSNTDILKTIYNLTIHKNKNSKIYYCCEGCGKSFDVIEDEKCPNCGNTFKKEEYDYFIEDIRG